MGLNAHEQGAYSLLDLCDAGHIFEAPQCAQLAGSRLRRTDQLHIGSMF